MVWAQSVTGQESRIGSSAFRVLCRNTSLHIIATMTLPHFNVSVSSESELCAYMIRSTKKEKVDALLAMEA